MGLHTEATWGEGKEVGHGSRHMQTNMELGAAMGGILEGRLP